MLDTELAANPSEPSHPLPAPHVRFAPVGTFDLAAAAALERAVSRVARGVRVVLDFNAVRRVEDRALLPVARALERLPGAELMLGGLTLHQRAVLLYLLR